MKPTNHWDGHNQNRDDPNNHAELIRLSTWAPRPIEWLWEPLIPRRKVTILVGEQEVGKTFFALNLAALLSWGRLPLPTGRFSEGRSSTLILSGDDDLEDTIFPRLVGLNANLDHVYTLTVNGPNSFSQSLPQISLADSVETINRAAKNIGDCRLIIIDPITAFIEGMGINSHIAVRKLLGRLEKLAKRHDAAVLVITHHRKAAADGVLHRTIGSLAFTVAARVVLTIIDDPATDGRRLLLPAKMNLRPIAECPGRAFSIEDGAVHWDPEPIRFRPDELHRLTTKGLTTSDRLLDVVDRLIGLLSQGPLPSLQIHDWAATQRIPRVLLFQAKAAANITARRDAEANQWEWQLVEKAGEVKRIEEAKQIEEKP
jgi:KaiC/GvpD/RAD55 family RecA-like ATPase